MQFMYFKIEHVTFEGRIVEKGASPTINFTRLMLLLTSYGLIYYTNAVKI